ncbi:MAG: hypothetical protein J6X17_09040 [Lachnospiraceae bacterium]|nr:hypothetical protein [Lachnospiraceae bacterium]MBP5653538.1 hypothetical protein [Lachnospiraceae bacterium]
MAQTKKKSSLGATIVGILFGAVFIVGIYLTVTRGRQQNAIEADAEVSEANTLISRDLEKDYPATVREVMKYYCRITKCLYSDGVSEVQLTELTDKLRELYTDDLLAANDRTEMIGLIKTEIKNYEKAGSKIQSYNVAESGEIKYYRNETPQRAIINIYFTIKQEKDNSFDRAYEEFVLVQDAKDRWKIMGWRMAEGQ